MAIDNLGSWSYGLGYSEWRVHKSNNFHMRNSGWEIPV